MMLAREGYDVDLFLFAVDEVMPTSLLEGASHISVHYLGSQPDAGAKLVGKTQAVWNRSFKTFMSHLRRNVGRLLTLLRFVARSDRGLIPREVLERTVSILGRNQYRAFIGVEKGGLTWAGAMASQLSRPLIYSSLELYTRDHWFYSGCYTQKRLKLAEEKYHGRCWATIVQDEARGKALLADNRVRSMRMLYVPVSRLGEPEAGKSHWLSDHLGLPHDQIVVLSHGLIANMRFSLELATLAQEFPTNWTLVIHGYGETSILQEIRRLDVNHKVSLSLGLVDLSEERVVVGSATVGLVFYRPEYLNDKLTGLSSEKLALSLQCGVPVIAFDYPSYGHIRDENCGVLISDLSEIPVAIRTILADYPGFTSRALSTFKKYYQFESNFRRVITALGELS